MQHIFDRLSQPSFHSVKDQALVECRIKISQLLSNSNYSIAIMQNRLAILLHTSKEISPGVLVVLEALNVIENVEIGPRAGGSVKSRVVVSWLLTGHGDGESDFEKIVPLQYCGCDRQVAKRGKV